MPSDESRGLLEWNKAQEGLDMLQQRYQNAFSRLKTEFRELEEDNRRLEKEKTDFRAETHTHQKKVEEANNECLSSKIKLLERSKPSFRS